MTDNLFDRLADLFRSPGLVNWRLAREIAESAAGTADPVEATFGAGGAPVSGNLFVLFDGNLAPGGTGAVGTLTLVGSLIFQGGDLALDLGATSDLVDVAEDVEISSGRIGNEQSTGSLTGPADVTVIHYNFNLLGSFTNAPVGSGFYLADEAVRVTHYGPAAAGWNQPTRWHEPAPLTLGQRTGYQVRAALAARAANHRWAR